MKNINRQIISKGNNRGTDLSLQWVIAYGEHWEAWRQLGEEWLNLQDSAVDHKLTAICIFIELYLIKSVPWTSDILTLFIGKNGWHASSNELKKIILDKTKRSDNADTATVMNNIYKFIEWVLESHFNEKLESGKSVSIYNNPFEKRKVKRAHSETVYNPLPYRYICDLRNILCPKTRGNFSDWKWAQSQTKYPGQWFEVDEQYVDMNDKDCVWRVKQNLRDGKYIKTYQIWSPVVAMTLFMKLHLPLRTYQIRMLDSGEADTLRYENGKWTENLRSFAFKNYSKGVFRKFKDNSTGIESTGLYINTNKTADRNKYEFDRGYTIPWQHEDVLYWCEKLRNWQEKYNPILFPTDCTSLKKKHTGQLKSSAYLSAMGQTCFLFRDASANNRNDRDKPINEMAISTHWYKLLLQLEINLKKSGDTLSDGTPYKLVHQYCSKDGEVKNTTRTKTGFPLHSLRVSLITSYILDAKLPLPVVSKLLAGHSRILMTVYYTKITPLVMREKMSEAEKLLNEKSQQSLKTFLKEAELTQITSQMAYRDLNAIEASLINRNPIGWEHRYYGLCLAGGNTVRSSESTILAGCWNGGEIVKDSDIVHNRVYNAVPNGPENCVRCRWFITDARYLSMLNSHLNFISYKVHEASNLAIQLESEIEVIEELKYEAEINSVPFLSHNKLQALQRRYEKQLSQVDEYTQDWIATFRLIRRIIEVENNREKIDQTNKLIAVGNENDINEIKIQFIETASELLHLSLLCEDAEVYPDLLDDIKKTSIIQKRVQSLSRVMMKRGQMPRFMMLDQDSQLIVTNAMMRQMVQQTNSKDRLEGFMEVVNYLELESFIQDSNLLDEGIKVLDKNINTSINSISLKLLTNSTKKGALSNDERY